MTMIMKLMNMIQKINLRDIMNILHLSNTMNAMNVTQITKTINTMNMSTISVKDSKLLFLINCRGIFEVFSAEHLVSLSNGVHFFEPLKPKTQPQTLNPTP